MNRLRLCGRKGYMKEGIRAANRMECTNNIRKASMIRRANMVRKASQVRKTNETKINMSLELLENGQNGSFKGTCGIGFMDHMVKAICVHGNMNITLEMTGDIEIDCHHSIEDLGIVFGSVFKEAAEKCNLVRFGTSYIPMDECLSRAVIDISGRPYLVFNADFKNQTIGAMDTCMIKEFFYAFTYSAGVTLHIENLYGDNDHHKAESIFKAFARALSKASKVKDGDVLSTKGVL